MAKLRIGREVLKSALERAVLSESERAGIERLLSGAVAKGPITTEVTHLPQACLKALLDDSRLSPNRRAVIVMHVHGMSSVVGPQREYVYNTTVANPVEFGSSFAMLGAKTRNTELFVNGRWYPITLNVQFLNDTREGNYLSKGELLHGTLSLCETAFGFSR